MDIRDIFIFAPAVICRDTYQVRNLLMPNYEYHIGFLSVIIITSRHYSLYCCLPWFLLSLFLLLLLLLILL